MESKGWQARFSLSERSSPPDWVLWLLIAAFPFGLFPWYVDLPIGAALFLLLYLKSRASRRSEPNQ